MWLYSNMENPVLTQPLVQNKSNSAGPQVSEEGIMMITSMGLTEKQARRGLRKCDNDVERAMDFIFSHMDEPDSEDEMKVDQVSNQEEEQKSAFKNDNPNAGTYKLQSFVTHLGTSIHSGHYVAHIKNGKNWTYYNDCKVAETTEPPIGKGYVYFFRR